MNLLQWSCPTDIRWLVISIVVYAVYRIAFSAWAGVGQIRFKRFSPLLADIYSSTSVILVLRVFRVLASVNHRSVSTIFRRLSLVVSGELLTCFFWNGASTRCGMPGTKATTFNDASRSAVTNASPCSVSAAGHRAGTASYKPHSKSLAKNVFYWGHSTIIAENFGRGWMRRLMRGTMEAMR